MASPTKHIKPHLKCESNAIYHHITTRKRVDVIKDNASTEAEA